MMGDISIADSIVIKEYLSGYITPTNIDRLDFDNNGVITEMDSVMVQAYLADIISSDTDEIFGKEADTVLPVDSERSYRIYDAATRTFISDYTLSPATAYFNGDNEVTDYPYDADNTSTWNEGGDDRYTDWSKSGTVKIMTNSGFGTGFVVDSHVIATCAHCVMSSSEICSISYIKLFNTDGTVSMTATPKEISVPTVYYESSSYNASYDYALITVEEDLSEYMTYKLGVALDSSFTDYSNRVNLPIYVTGFPGTSEGGNNGYSLDTMVTGVGNLLTKSEMDTTLGYGLLPYQLVYDTYVSGGDSGGPAYIQESFGSSYNYNTVIAINSSGYTRFSAATRITTELLLFYLNNPYINYQ